MKNFRVLNIMESTMSVTNQPIGIVELSEIKYMNFSLPSGDKPFTFSPSGETYIFDLRSTEFLEILTLARDEEIVSLNSSDFTDRTEIQDGRRQITHYHKKINLI